MGEYIDAKDDDHYRHQREDRVSCQRIAQALPDHDADVEQSMSQDGVGERQRQDQEQKRAGHGHG